MLSTILSKTKKIKLTSSVLALVALMFATTTYAQDDNSGPIFGKNAPGKWTIGVKAAQIDPNIEGISDADALGVVLGYEFANPIPRFGGTASVELDFIQSLSLIHI